MSLLQSGFGSSGDDYEITDSLRFRSASDAYLNRTFSTPTNNKKWSYSVWMKRGTLSTNQAIISSNVDGANYWDMRFNTSDQIFIQNRVSSSNLLVSNTTAVYRDSSAWYHITFVFDSDNSTASHRNRLYINGVEQTLSANSGSGDASYWNVNAVQHNIGVSRTLNSSGGIWAEYDGYQTEANFIDGQALDPTDFGEYDANGTWKPKEYTGTYGTNGFYLPMKPTTQAELQNTVIFSADGTGSSVSGFGFTPDFIWAKNRTNTYNHELWDTVRGTASDLASNSFAAEITDGNRLISFDSDGFSYGTGSNLYVNNTDSVAWGWDAGDNQPSTGHSSILYTAATADGTYDIKGFGFNPDLLWIKNRNNSERNFLFDTVRGVDSSKALVSDSTAAEGLNGINATTISTIEDGFRIVESSINSGELYFNNRTYVAWGWDAGDGDPVSNTTGDINSTVKANDATGFSIVSYTGNGTSNSEQTIGHGLSTAPKVVIVKDRTSASTRWSFYSTDLSSDGTYAVKNLLLNTTGAESAYSSQIRGIQGSNTFSVRDVDANGNANVNKSGDNYIAYCFSEVSGVSKFGSYTGNGSSNGPTVTGLGFRPGFVLVKAISTGQGWTIWDSTRGPFNTVTESLSPNSSSAESNFYTVDFNDDGFQIKSSYSVTNQSGHTYIYMAFKGSYSDHVSPLNDDGSIDSRVKANPDKGFSIVSWEGSSATTTVGHGLSTAPKVIIAKNRDASGTEWPVYHDSVNSGGGSYLRLNGNYANTSSSIIWTGSPTSSVINVGSYSYVNSNSMIAYCFSEVAGYSKFGSYTGTGSAGLSVTTGFRPAFVMTKRSDSTSNWNISDSRRSPTGTANTTALRANTTDTENTVGTAYVKFTDTGFEITGTSTETNANGGTYIYMAFADTADAVFNFDASGNKNNWLPNNINSNAESETTYDLMKDTPSLVDENAANFCTMNALNGIGTISDGNMTLLSTVANWQSRGGTVAVSSGKWYWEAHVITRGTYMQIGIVGSDVFFQSTDDIQEWPTGYGYYSVGKKVHNAANSSYGTTFTTGDLIGIALDLDAGTIEFYKNNVSQGVAFTGISGEFIPAFAVYGGSGKVTANFGQRPFAYTPPTGFLKLNTFNLPDSTIEDGSDYFNTVLYTGNGSTQAITGVGFQPNLTWFKSRSVGYDHQLHDVLRSPGVALLSNSSQAEFNYGTVSSFDSDGFTVDATSYIGTNASGATFVSWNWKANGSGVTNNAGANGATIASTYSANTKAGFSIVTYTGSRTSDGGETGTPTKIYHGLGKKPEMVITKNRTSQTYPVWNVWHKGYQPDTTHLNYQLFLHLTSASNNAGWQRTDQGFTTNLFCPARYAYDDVNGVDYIAYVFTGIEGYSSFGSYTGNGSTDGPFIYTGFRPAWVMVKKTSGTGSWYIYDLTRLGYNGANYVLAADSSTAEISGKEIDLLSNGFKWRSTTNNGNASGGTYIYMAFAENPFKNALAR